MEKKDNIVDKIKLIKYSIPQNCTDLEKVRYIYMKLGHLFCYDFRIIINESIAHAKLDYNNISQFQTCTQISEVLAMLLQNFNGNAEAKVIKRPLPNGDHCYSHVATEVKFKDTVTGEEYKLLLDLTLDLFRIQAGLQTMQFGYTTDSTGSYDIIPLRECEEMDLHLHLIYNDEYRDKKVEEVRKYLLENNMPLRDKLTYMWQMLQVNFRGSHELMRYAEYLIPSVLPKVQFRNFNLYHKNLSEEEFAILFIIRSKEQDEEVYLLFDNQLGIIFSSRNNVIDMLDSEWSTNSQTLYTLLDSNSEPIKKL